MQQPCNYRVSVKAVIMHDNKLLMISGEGGDSGWELPGGGLEHNETIEQALARELHEEIGVNSARILDSIHVLPVFSELRKKAYLHIMCPVQLSTYPPEGKLGDITLRYVSRQELAEIPLDLYRTEHRGILQSLVY